MKRMTAVIAILALLTVGATMALAQPGMGKHGMKGHAELRGGPGMGAGAGIQLWLELGLSDKQIEKIMKIRYGKMKDGLSVKREMYEVHQQIVTLKADPVANEQKLKELAGKVAERHVDRSVARAVLHQKIWDVLTDEQKEKAGGSIEELFSRPQQGEFYPHGRGMGHGQRKGGRPGFRSPVGEATPGQQGS